MTFHHPNAYEFSHQLLFPIQQLWDKLTDEQRKTPWGELVMWIVKNSAIAIAQVSNFIEATNKLTALETLERLVPDTLTCSREHIIGVLRYQQQHCTFIDDALYQRYYGSSLNEMLNTAEQIPDDTSFLSFYVRRLMSAVGLSNSANSVNQISANVKKIVAESKVQIGQHYLAYSSFTIAVSSIMGIIQVVNMYSELSNASNVVSSGREKLNGIIKSNVDEANRHLAAAVRYLEEGPNRFNNACIRISQANLCISKAREELALVEIKVGNAIHQLGLVHSSSLGTAVSTTVLTIVQILATSQSGSIALWAKIVSWGVAATQAGLATAAAVAYVITDERLKELRETNEKIIEQRKNLDKLSQSISETTEKIELM